MASTPEHRRRVCTLYRNYLRECYNWSACSRERYYLHVEKTRAAFRKNMTQTNPRVVEKLIVAAEDELRRIAHPEPYCYPNSPGGSSYQRNIAPPIQVVENGWAAWDIPEVEEHFETEQVY